MENKNNSFQDFVKPILVLVIICFVVTLALAFTYGITKPIIDKNTMAAANATRNELLPAANGDFESYDGDMYVLEENKVYISEVYTAKNGSGMVATAMTNSYGGLLTAMIGIDKDGAITKVKVTDAADTAGIGTKAQQPGHLKQYAGLNALGNVNIKQDSTVKYITGASVSSTAIHKAVWASLQQYKSMGGVQ